jgi:DNA-binding PadR family transcriptional regulator
MPLSRQSVHVLATLLQDGPAHGFKIMTRANRLGAHLTSGTLYASVLPRLLAKEYIIQQDKTYVITERGRAALREVYRDNQVMNTVIANALRNAYVTNNPVV